MSRKRIRLSSPTFDDQVDDPSQDDLTAFDSIDAQLSQDYAAWFSPDASTATLPTFQRPSVAGSTPKSLFVPSATALRAAEEKMKQWQQEIDTPPAPAAHEPPETPAALPDPTPTRPRTWLQNGKRPFKSPLVRTTPRHPSTPTVNSPLRDSNALVSPLRPSSLANHATSQRPLGFTSAASTRPKFVTPFKLAAKSNPITAFSPTPKSLVNRIYPSSVPFSPQPCKQNTDKKVCDLTRPFGRRTLANSGLRPQSYSVTQLEGMGIEFKELGRVDLRTAPFYAFRTRTRSPPDPFTSLALDRSAALEELHSRGCTLAKQAWVDNHWSLVLWKLAGMVALDPTAENNPSNKRWCWPELIRQLMYRYERDLNNSSRPPFRLITTRDASAESPMVLCISDIIWPDPDDDAIQTHPELEVTDGWYRLRARIDAPIARAIRKGKIKIGRKLAVASAKLSAERKEGSEILEAYNSNVLVLTGNSTHMAPWHAKLGFQRQPFIATLNSLTPDGGSVAVMRLTVVKAYPVAYIEFKDADGQKQREGPHDAKVEMTLSTQWKSNRESHASKLWSEYEKRRCRLLDYAEHLEQRAGSKFKPDHEDGPPDKIYDLYDTLREDPEATKNILSSIGHQDAGWLARHIHERAVRERDEISNEIEQELESICPPRDVKVFCVVVVRDTRTHKRPSNRTAQVTVWDVPGVSIHEGCAQNPFIPAQQYIVTNLAPTQPSAWMDRSPGAEVYLTTRKNSKWTLVS